MNNDARKSLNDKDGFPVGGKHAHFILITCSLLYMINCIDRQVLSVVMEPMKAELGLSDALLGTLQTVFLLSIAFLAYPISFVMDRWSRKKAISLMALIWSIFTFVTGLGRSFLGVLIPRTLVAAGEAGFSAGGTALIGAAYPHHTRARALGIFNATIPLGMGIGVILGGVISAKYGWRAPFFIFAVPGIVLGIVALFMKDYKTTEDLDETGKRKGFFTSAISLFQIPTLRWTYLGNAMQNITAYSFLTWAPAFVMRAQGVGEDKAGLLIGILSLMAIVGAPLGGVIADLWQNFN
jgi:predicted MFS family arabinose efflux permease